MEDQSKLIWKKAEHEVVKFEEVGDSIEGKYIAKTESESFGSDIYTLKTPSGFKKVFSTIILKDKMDLVPYGSAVKIIYQGEKKNDSGRTYKLFEVFYQ